MTGTDRDSDRNTKYYAHSENDRDEKHGLLTLKMQLQHN
jgi:hypothetical protein